MAEIFGIGDINYLTVHDESKTAVIGFTAINPPGFVELKITRDSDDAYDAMVSAAAVGLHLSTTAGHQVHVRYDDSGDEAFELDEITIHS
jgi:hypothetical protein